jgi:hypothetical protein
MPMCKTIFIQTINTKLAKMMSQYFYLNNLKYAAGKSLVF